MYQKRLEEQEKQLRPITRKCRTLVNTKESQGGAANMIFAYFHTFFLLDLIEYSSVVSRVKSYEKAILQHRTGRAFRITAGRNSWMRKRRAVGSMWRSFIIRF